MISSHHLPTTFRHSTHEFSHSLSPVSLHNCRYTLTPSVALTPATTPTATGSTVAECKRLCREMGDCFAFQVDVDGLPSTCSFYTNPTGPIGADATARSFRCYQLDADWGYGSSTPAIFFDASSLRLRVDVPDTRETSFTCSGGNSTLRLVL